MSLHHVYGGEVKISFMDIFKSSRALKAERAAATRKREELAEKYRILTSKPIVPNASQNQNCQGKKSADAKGGGGKNMPESGGNNKGVQVVPPIIPNDVPQSNPGPTISNGNSCNKDDSAAASQSGWTPGKDADLLIMKEQQNLDWDAIVKVLGKSKKEAKKRYGQIMTRDKGSQHRDQTDTKAAASQEASNGAKHREPTKALKAISELEQRLTMEELVFLRELVAKFEEEKWLKISSRFFDKNGKHITPEEVKKYVEGVEGLV